MFDPTPFPPLLHFSHLLFGGLGFGGALIALASKKGGNVHVSAGRVMFVTMSVSAVTALLLMLTKFSVPPVVNSITALVGLITGILALQKPSAIVRRAEIALSAILLLTVIWFLFNALPQIWSGNLFFMAPVTVVLVSLIFLIDDARYLRKTQVKRVARIRRHLTRMVWTLAVLVRAPLFELRDELGLSLPIVLVAPLMGAAVLQWLFWKKANHVATVPNTPL